MSRLKKYNLLFLEDNELFAKNMSEFFGEYFNEVFHVTNIKDALKTFQEKNVHTVISDIKVEDGNGLEFVSKVRELDKSTPIVILSAHKDEDFLFKAIPLNLFDYLIKPITYDTLITLLSSIENLLEEMHKELIHIKKNYYYDRRNKYILLDKRVITLTDRETKFIELLIKNKNALTTRELIEQEVYNGEIMSEAALKNLILRIRKKLGNDFVETVAGLGFRL